MPNLRRRHRGAVLLPRTLAALSLTALVLAGLGVGPGSPTTASATVSTTTSPTIASPKAAPVKTARRLVDRVELGAYVDGMTHAPHRLAAFESLVRAPVDIASYYWGFGDIFPGATERSFARNGTRKVLLSWDMGPTRFSEWTDGRHDDYLDDLVAASLAYPWTVYVRPWPEMNGDWQEFQPTLAGSRPYGGTYAEFRAAWRYLVTYFRARGVTNLRWVFNPTVDVYAGTTPVGLIWPGAAYVDVLGIDGFNWGRDASWGRWQSFEQTFAPMYRRLTALHPTAPVWICEVGSKEPSRSDGAPRDLRQSKARWTKDALTTRSFPRLRAVIWFHARKERDWRVNSSPGALRVLRRQLR